jgi:tetratricopeptide (TPR) repeat protein
MRLLVQLFFLVLLVQAVSAQEAIQNDVPSGAAIQCAAAATYKNKNQLEQSRQEYVELRKKYPNSFSIVYDYGRLLAQMKEYQESAKALGVALKIGVRREQLPDPSLYNTIGYVHIMLGDFDQALEYFKMAAGPKTYNRLAENTKMKLHNNTGYALMLADRYEESLGEFAKARAMGSRKAVENIEKVQSLIETQEQQRPDLPGIFAVVIHSTRNKETLDALARGLLAELQGTVSKEKQQELNKPVIYVAKNGMYFIALASNSSYAKAQELLSVVRKVITDAFVSSTTNWVPYQIAGKLVPVLMPRPISMPTQEAPADNFAE